VRDPVGEMRAPYAHLGLVEFEGVLPRLPKSVAQIKEDRTNRDAGRTLSLLDAQAVGSMARVGRRPANRITMAQIPFHLRYKLSRLQRLVPHLRIWGAPQALLALVLFLFFCVQTVSYACRVSVEGGAMFGGLAVVVFVLYRGLFVGLFDVLLVPVRYMDVIVEENAAGVQIGSERWYLFLDGITDLRKFRDDTWTIQHYNGCVLHIAADAIREDQIAHLRAAMERGRTPEGIRAVIERGKRIKEIEESGGEAKYPDSAPERGGR
jgi:hypothetical protein